MAEEFDDVAEVESGDGIQEMTDPDPIDRETDAPRPGTPGRVLTDEEVEALADEEVERAYFQPPVGPVGRGATPEPPTDPYAPPGAGGPDPSVGRQGGTTFGEIDEPPIEVGMMVRMERRGEEVPALVMAVYDDEVIDALVFSMVGPAHVRPMERTMRTMPGNGGWWHDWESRR